MQLFPNPYHHIDHKGRLAGACRMGEAVRSPESMPAGLVAGAAPKVVSFKEAAGPTVQSKTDRMFVWSGEPISVEKDPDGFYWERLRCQEVFEVVGEGVVAVHAQDGKPPRKISLLDALAGARLDAIAQQKALYLQEPNTSSWAEQFPHDKAVEEAMSAVAKKREADAKKAADEAPKPEAAPKKKPFPLIPPAVAAAQEPSSKPSASAADDKSASALKGEKA